MAGIIAGALDGLGQGLMATGQLYGAQAMEDQRNQGAMNLAQMQSDLALQREQALDQFKSQLAVDTANQQRQAQVDRINSAQQGIIASARAANANKFYGGDSNLSDDDLTDDEKKQFAPTDAQQQNAYLQAATQTGDIDPKTVANNASKQDIAAMREDAYRASIAAKLEASKERSDIMLQIAQLKTDAAKEMKLNGKIDTATGRMLITSEDANIKAATSQLNMLNNQLGSVRPNEKAGIQAQMEQLRADIKESQDNKATYLRQLGYLPDKSGNSPTAPGVSADKNNPLGLDLPSRKK